MADGLIHRWDVSHAASYDGDRLLSLLDKGNTASSVWTDTACRSEKNQTYLEQNGFCSNGLVRAKTKIGLANLAYNIRRFLWLEGRSLPV